MTKLYQLLSGAALAAMTTFPAHALLLTQESFDYTAGVNISGQSGGSGWRSPSNPTWTSGGTTGTVAAPGLQYSDVNADYTQFLASGNTASLSGERNLRFLDIDSGGVYDGAGLRGGGNYIGGTGVDGDLWGSFMFTASDYSASGAYTLFNLFTTAGGDGLAIRQSSAGSNFQLTNSSATVIGTGSIALGSLSTTDPNLIVYKYGFDSAANSDTFEVWLNPLTAGDTADITLSGANLALNNIEIREVLGNVALSLDEIRLGTEFTDVVPIPEPASAAMLVAATGLLLLRRRK